MATIRQVRLADALIANTKKKKPQNKKELLVSAGYDETTAKATPALIIEQKGVQQALIERGFTEDNAKRVVAEILEDKYTAPAVRLKAADMIFEVHGSKAATKSISMSVNSEDLRARIVDDIKRFQPKPNA